MAGLFGPSPAALAAEIEDERRQNEANRFTQMAIANPSFAAVAAFGSGFNTLFSRGMARSVGLSGEDPRVAEAQSRHAIQDAITQSGAAPGTQEYTELGTRLFLQSGRPDLAMEWTKRALALEETQANIAKKRADAAQANLDPASNRAWYNEALSTKDSALEVGVAAAELGLGEKLAGGLNNLTEDEKTRVRLRATERMNFLRDRSTISSPTREGGTISRPQPVPGLEGGTAASPVPASPPPRSAPTAAPVASQAPSEPALTPDQARDPQFPSVARAEQASALAAQVRSQVVDPDAPPPEFTARRTVFRPPANARPIGAFKSERAFNQEIAPLREATAGLNRLIKLVQEANGVRFGRPDLLGNAVVPPGAEELAAVHKKLFTQVNRDVAKLGALQGADAGYLLEMLPSPIQVGTRGGNLDNNRREATRGVLASYRELQAAISTIAQTVASKEARTFSLPPMRDAQVERWTVPADSPMAPQNRSLLDRAADVLGVPGSFLRR